MKAEQLAELVDASAKLVDTVGNISVASDLVGLAVAISRGGNKSFAKFLESLEAESTNQNAGEGRRLGEIEPFVARVADLLNRAGAKKAVLSDFQLLLDVLRRQGQLSVSDFDSASVRSVASASKGRGKPGVRPVDKQPIIDDYLRRLEKALGDDREFQSTLMALTADERMDRSDVVTIASQFVAPTAPSTTRPKALRMIASRHERLVRSRAASASIGGKAA